MRWIVAVGCALALGCGSDGEELSGAASGSGGTAGAGAGGAGAQGGSGGGGGQGGTGGAETGGGGSGGSGGGPCQPLTCGDVPWLCGAATDDGCGSTIDCSANVCSSNNDQTCNPVSGACECDEIPNGSLWDTCNAFAAATGDWCNYGGPGEPPFGNCIALDCGGDQTNVETLPPGCQLFDQNGSNHAVCCQPPP